MQKWLIPLSLIAALAAAWHWRADLQSVVPVAVTMPTSTSTSTSTGTSTGTSPLRKCLRGGEVQYTNQACPAGFTAEKVDDSRLTVLPATPVKPVKPADAASGNAQQRLQKALDVAPDPGLKERMMERAVQGAQK